MRQPVFFNQGLIAQRFFYGVQVLPLKVLDQRQLCGLPIVRLDNDSGNFVQVRNSCGSPATLTGDDLVVAAAQLPNGQGLQDAMDGNGVGQRLQLRFVEIMAGLFGVRLYFIYRQQLIWAFFGGYILTEIAQ